jgi:hypothetical protein
MGHLSDAFEGVIDLLGDLLSAEPREFRAEAFRFLKQGTHVRGAAEITIAEMQARAARMAALRVASNVA